MKIPYSVYPDRYGSHVYSVRLNVSIALSEPGAPRTKRFEAIIDSGATRCMFHSNIGRFLGLDIESGEKEITQGIGGLTDAYLHDITLYIPGGPVTIKAAFKQDLPIAALLGMNGFFEHFVVTFNQQALTCDLERIYQA
ncbi:MAG: hypothetical protein ABR976_11765 [Terracidiphilus sp.]